VQKLQFLPSSGSSWSAGCDESRTSGAEGGPGKRTGSDPDTAPRSDPYIVGNQHKSAMGTLVERKTGYLMLLHLPDDHGAIAVQEAMITKMSRLPETLRQTLTWDQGIEMANHAQIAAATDLDIYFCDPTRRGSAARMRTPTGCCGNTFSRAPTCLSGPRLPGLRRRRTQQPTPQTPRLAHPRRSP
jgi:hypothetical protein